VALPFKRRPGKIAYRFVYCSGGFKSDRIVDGGVHIRIPRKNGA
jgi:hypothetical protein